MGSAWSVLHDTTLRQCSPKAFIAALIVRVASGGVGGGGVEPRVCGEAACAPSTTIMSLGTCSPRIGCFRRDREFRTGYRERKASVTCESHSRAAYGLWFGSGGLWWALVGYAALFGLASCDFSIQPFAHAKRVRVRHM